MTKKILFTDMDGTLLNDQAMVSDHTRDSLRFISDKGHIIVLSSGRSLHSILETASSLDILVPGMYISAANGAVIYECDTQKVLFKSPVALEDVKCVWLAALNEGIHIQTYTDNELIVPSIDREVNYYTIKCPHPIIISQEPWNILDEPPAKLLAINLDDHQKLDAFGSWISKHNANLTTMFSNDWYLEIISSKAGKGNSLIWLCNYLKIPISSSYAAGDSFNDVSMINAAGTGIVMCNGDPKIFDYADVITELDNNHDGLLQYIVKEFI